MSRLASQIPAIWGKCLHEEERLRRQGTEAGPPPEPETGYFLGMGRPDDGEGDESQAVTPRAINIRVNTSRLSRIEASIPEPSNGDGWSIWEAHDKTQREPGKWLGQNFCPISHALASCFHVMIHSPGCQHNALCQNWPPIDFPTRSKLDQPTYLEDMDFGGLVLRTQ